MTTKSRDWLVSPEGIAQLWLGVLAGPAAWALDLGVSYAVVQWTCGSQERFVSHFVSLVALTIVAIGGLASWRAWEQSRAGSEDREPLRVGSVRLDRGRFMAMWGLLSCALFTLVIIATAVPKWVIDPCQST